MSAVIDTERLARVTRLYNGSHDENEDAQWCVMEAVAYIAVEPWSDAPQCASPVISAFMRAWNDSLPDDERTALLLPLIQKLVGTRGSEAIEKRRALLAADWYVRVYTPEWLRIAGLTAQADALASLPEITDMAKVPGIMPALEAVRKDASAARSEAWLAARSAAESAAWSAAESAAWSAAESAAESAAWLAAESAARSEAWSAARLAAWSAARLAAESAAWSAAWSALSPTKQRLQQSALMLVERMIAVRDEV